MININVKFLSITISMMLTLILTAQGCMSKTITPAAGSGTALKSQEKTSLTQTPTVAVVATAAPTPSAVAEPSPSIAAEPTARPSVDPNMALLIKRIAMYKLPGEWIRNIVAGAATEADLTLYREKVDEAAQIETSTQYIKTKYDDAPPGSGYISKNVAIEKAMTYLNSALKSRSSAVDAGMLKTASLYDFEIKSRSIWTVVFTQGVQGIPGVKFENYMAVINPTDGSLIAITYQKNTYDSAETPRPIPGEITPEPPAPADVLSTWLETARGLLKDSGLALNASIVFETSLGSSGELVATFVTGSAVYVINSLQTSPAYTNLYFEVLKYE